jgi:hypothetical protein
MEPAVAGMAVDTELEAEAAVEDSAAAELEGATVVICKAS